jgi:uncharacterized protein (TIGR03067 family)
MWLRASLVCVCILGLAASASAADKTDQDKIQGKWKVESIVKGGKTTDEGKEMVLTFDGDKIKMTREGQEHLMGFKLDESKKPKWITVDIMGKPGEGIYSLEGDTLKVCHGEGDNPPRPTEFVSKEGSNVVILTLKRVK